MAVLLPTAHLLMLCVFPPPLPASHSSCMDLLLGALLSYSSPPPCPDLLFFQSFSAELHSQIGIRGNPDPSNLCVFVLLEIFFSTHSALCYCTRPHIQEGFSLMPCHLPGSTMVPHRVGEGLNLYRFSGLPKRRHFKS